MFHPAFDFGCFMFVVRTIALLRVSGVGYEEVLIINIFSSPFSFTYAHVSMMATVMTPWWPQWFHVWKALPVPLQQGILQKSARWFFSVVCSCGFLRKPPLLLLLMVSYGHFNQLFSAGSTGAASSPVGQPGPCYLWRMGMAVALHARMRQCHRKGQSSLGFNQKYQALSVPSKAVRS